MITLAVLTLIYFLPTVIASHRGHNVGGILILNFFFGWTGIGWLALLLWALVARPRYYFVPATVFHPYYGWRRF